MVAGDSGVSGALVQRVAKKESNQEHVNVIHQLHSMEGRNVMARQRKHKTVTRMFPVQVARLATSLIRHFVYSSNVLRHSKFIFEVKQYNGSCISSHRKR